MVAGLLAMAAPALGASLHLSSANVAQPGDIAEVCMTLDSEGESIAGTQNDLVWDGACATLGECRVDPSTRKDLSGRFQNNEDFRYRALVLSLFDVDPIRDGRLYCCDFQVDAAARSCCEVRTVDAQAADPNGNALSLGLGAPAQLCVGPIDGTPFVTAMPTFTPTPRQSPAEPGLNGGSGASAAGGDGCQLVAADRSSAWPGLGALAAILAWVAPRCSRSTRRSTTRR